MTVEAVAALAREARPETTPAQSLRPAAESLSDTGATPAADAFRAVLEGVHTDVTRFANDPTTAARGPDPVEAAKAEIAPPTTAPDAIADGNQILRKTFDHAVFVTLVSQVVSGLSQTTSTLIRQQ